VDDLDVLGAAQVRRHGAVLAVDHGTGVIAIAERRAWTRHGARRAFSEFEEEVLDLRMGDLQAGPPAGASQATGRTLIAACIEGGEVAVQFAVPIDGGSDDGPSAGVREPRWPRPSVGGASAACAGK
jgi:hypothetical protein